MQCYVEETDDCAENIAATLVCAYLLTAFSLVSPSGGRGGGGVMHIKL